MRNYLIAATMMLVTAALFSTPAEAAPPYTCRYPFSNCMHQCDLKYPATPKKHDKCIKRCKATYDSCLAG